MNKERFNHVSLSNLAQVNELEPDHPENMDDPEISQKLEKIGEEVIKNWEENAKRDAED